MFRRASFTARYFDGGLRDRQTGPRNSWWITRMEAVAIRPADSQHLWKLLLKPPHQFALGLAEPGCLNHLHCTIANDMVEVKAGTPLAFTVNNIPHTYTVNELEDAIRNGGSGKEPGVQALMRFLGPCQLLAEEKREKRGPGRPPAGPDAKVLDKTLARSGY